MIILIMDQFYIINADVIDLDDFLEFWECDYDDFNLGIIMNSPNLII